MPDFNSASVGNSTDSTSDGRIVNNTLRHQYRTLSESEKALMLAVKDKGAELLAILHQAGGTQANQDRMGSRELSIAQTKLEEAVMWAVKHITK